MKSTILHIYPTLRFRGGAEKLLHQLCESFSQDYQIVIVSDDKDLHFPYASHHHAHLFETGIWGGIKGLVQLFKLYRRHRPAIIQSHHRKTTLLSSLLRPFLGFKLIHTHHVKLEDKPWWRFFKADLYVAVGHQVSKNLLHFFRVSPKRVKVIPNGVPRVSVEPSERSSLKQTAVVVGRLEEQKGHIYLVKAWPKVIEKVPDARLLLVGDGSLRALLQQEIKSLGVENSIEFLGFREDPWNWINRAQFVILPSLWEGLPLTILEAFSLGKTVVASNIDGNSEVVEHQKTGLIFKNMDVEDLAQKVVEMFEKPEMREDLSARAHILFKEKYTHEIMISGYAQVYQQLQGNNIP